jgi:hypothetical protein
LNFVVAGLAPAISFQRRQTIAGLKTAAAANMTMKRRKIIETSWRNAKDGFAQLRLNRRAPPHGLLPPRYQATP